MEFNFSCNNEDIVAAQAFAVDKDNNIRIAHGNKPIDIRDMASILGAAINDVLKSDGTDNDFVEKRDKAHEILRIFARQLNVDPLAANWHDADKELPHIDFILFTLKEDDEYRAYIREGWIDLDTGFYTANDGGVYKPQEIAYWMPYPSAPIKREEET